MARTYKRTESVIARQIAGETLLVPVTGDLPDLQQIYALDEVSVVVWGLLDGTRSLEDIAGAVAADFDVTAEAAQSDVEVFLAELCDRGLAEPA